MEKNCSSRDKFIVNLKHLPPIDPFSATNPSSERKLNNFSTRNCVSKAERPSQKQKMKLVDDPSISSSMEGREFLLDTENATSGNRAFQTDSAAKGTIKGSATARSHLYEICAANNWKPPLFECCKEEGPCHARMFTFKVIVEIEAASNIVLECFGAPCSKKKTAAEHAAEGALWYLKHLGYVLKNQ
ncbi:Dicer-like protein 4-like [Quillaja saponaria]|uniref:Dicer-like protein 4-like n=1 Tax=Quillaja saponaria TaxID=32244 RepID=A0AAD7LTH5_QUISA|nr:Dicer-like protein 4-like [Quillaja saponaria]